MTKQTFRWWIVLTRDGVVQQWAGASPTRKDAWARAAEGLLRIEDYNGNDSAGRRKLLQKHGVRLARVVVTTETGRQRGGR